MPAMALSISTAETCSMIVRDNFKYGKELALEALETISSKSDAASDVRSDEDLVSFFSFIHSVRDWTLIDWVTRWKLIRDMFGKVLFPENYVRFRERCFKIAGRRARSLGTETVDFIDSVLSNYHSSANADGPSLEVQDVTDLMDTVIHESLLYNQGLKEKFIQKLVDLCSDFKKLPGFLELQGLEFSDVNRPFAGGGTADIFRAEFKGLEVVVKVPKRTWNKGEAENWTLLHKEALNWLVGVRCNGLNWFLGITYEHPSGIGLVFMYQPNGNLLGYLDNNPEIDRMGFVSLKSFDIAITLNSLHQIGLIHGDIKAENILVSKDEHPLLTDFGSMGRIIHGDSSAPPRLHAESGTESNDSSGSGFNGTAWFMSKERIFDGKRTEADEVWAFGMTLIQLLTHKPPLIDRYKNQHAFTSALVSGTIEFYRSDLPEAVPDDLFDVIKRCLSQDPADRPSSFELFVVMGKVAGNHALKGCMDVGYS